MLAVEEKEKEAPVTAGKKRKAEQEKADATPPTANMGAESNKKAKAAASPAVPTPSTEGIRQPRTIFWDCASGNS